jgi:hypothetical protein
MSDCAFENPKISISVRGFGFKRYFWSSSRPEAMEIARKEAQADAWRQMLDKVNLGSIVCGEGCEPFYTITRYSERVDFDWEVTLLLWPFNYYYVKATVYVDAEVVTGCRRR